MDIKKLITRSMLVCCLTAPTISFSNVGKDLDNFFTGLGYDSNTTTPDAYMSQAAGSYGSGSLYVRNQVKQYQLVQLDMPSFKAGCGGIDLYTGSLSFINGDRLKELGKSVMTNAGAYAFDVALSSTIPELKQIKDNLQAIEQKMNNANINSCELGKNLVGGLWPKTEESQKKICKDQGTMGKGGVFSDYVNARMGCSGDEFDNVMEKARKDPERKQQVILGKNIVWSLLKDKSAILSSDNELAELVMSLTGTIIIDKKGGVTNVPSLANSKNLINGLLGNDTGTTQKVKIWGCIGNDCMKVELKEIDIAANQSLRTKVSTLIQSLYQHVKDDVDPSKAEKNLVAMTHIPIFRFITVLAATEYGVNAVDLNDYSSLIAQELLTQYLSELLQEVHNVTANSLLTESLIKSLEQRITVAEGVINRLTPEVGHKLDEKLKLIQRVQTIEKQIAINAQESMR